MSKHTLHTRGLVFEWSDDDKDYSKEHSLFGLYDIISNMYSHSMYDGEDPEKEWNDHISELQNKVIDWIIELKREDKK